MTIEEISDVVNGRIEVDNGADITGVGKIESAGKSDITFISNPQYNKFFDTTGAGAVILSNDFIIKTKRNDISVIRVDDPYLSFLKLLEILEKHDDEELNGISDHAVIGENTETGQDVFAGNFVSIGKDCRIGNSTRIHSSCSIDSNVTIGSNCILYPNVIVYKGCIIGDNVIIHSGAVIGADGFGFAKNEDGSYRKIPQTGIVRISDDVEIGANTCIDRATIGETKIGKGVKIDDQVMIAHNVEIGDNTVIAAQAGIAGSTKIGKRCVIAGQAGIVGHITICDDVTIGASVGVSKSITEPGVYIGYRAKPQNESLRTDVQIRNLGKLEERIKELERKITK